MDDPQLKHYLLLSMIPGVGPRIRQSLLARFYSPEGILAAPTDRLREVPGVGPKLARAITSAGASGPITTCVRPHRSRRSMKMTPLWSRMRSTQPQSVTF